MRKKPKNFYPTDTEAEKECIRILQEHSHKFTRPSPYQFKVGENNFWPATGRITIDPNERYPAKGLDAFIDLLEGRGLIITIGH